MNDNMALFAATLLHSATNTHFFHWNTDSFSKHMALGAYYDEIVELTDDLVEAYMGCYDKITTFPNVYHQPKEAIKYLTSLKSFVDDARKDLPQETQIQNIVDEIAQLIDSPLYKLKNLK